MRSFALTLVEMVGDLRKQLLDLVGEYNDRRAIVGPRRFRRIARRTAAAAATTATAGCPPAGRRGRRRGGDLQRADQIAEPSAHFPPFCSLFLFLFLFLF